MGRAEIVSHVPRSGEADGQSAQILDAASEIRPNFATVLDALVLLGCRILRNGEPAPAGQRRVREAARAFHRGAAPLVIVSGGRRWDGRSEAETLAAELERLGVPRSAILLELRSLSTAENARYVAELLAERSARRVGVVTCDWHAPRAISSFRAAGVSAEAIPAASPREGIGGRARRAARERLSSVIDRWATWGWERH